jgi:hypothetical protein
LSPQNGGFIRAFWLVPGSCGKDFRAVAAGGTKWKVRSDFKWKKLFFKVEKPIQVGFLQKAIVLNRIYTEIVV